MAQTLAAIFRQGDDQLRRDYVPAGSAVVQGEVVDLGSLIGICTSPEGIAVGARGSLATAGIFSLKKVPADAIAHGTRGQPVYFDISDQKVVFALTGDQVYAGIVDAISLTTDDHVDTDINRIGPQNVAWTTTTTTTTSDRRLKTRIRRIGMLAGLTLYSYRLKGSRIPLVGFMAQEVYEMYPKAVIVGGADPSINPWRINYAKLFEEVGLEAASRIIPQLKLS